MDIIGKIYSIKLENFITYDSVTFFPGEHLNIITGPNGTGKSTLVAAILLGMGGAPKTLSRSTNIKDYIKNGKEFAKIEIEIYANEDRELTQLCREFDIDGRNEFSIDNSKQTHSRFLKEVAKFNIQIDNLCQFLPQDRVQDFAKLNAQELLASTQNSVCSEEMQESFEKLKLLRHEQTESVNSLKSSTEKLKEYEQQNDALKTQIENIKVRTTLLKDIEICKKKEAWLTFDETYLKLKETEADLLKAKENYEKHQRTLKPYETEYNQIEMKKAEYEKKISICQKKCDEFSAKLNVAEEKGDVIKGAIQKAKGDFQFIVSSRAERQNELEQAKKVMSVLTLDVKNAKLAAGSEDEQKQKTNELTKKTEIRKLETAKLLEKRRNITNYFDENIKPELNSIANKIKNIENIEYRKLELLRRKYDHAYRGVMWIRENKSLFQGKIYEPMILELNIPDTTNAKYFENVISMRDLVAFTCEQKEDMALLHRKLRTEQKLNINIIHSEPADCVHFKPRTPIEKLRQFGFHSYLIDLISGPAPIINALCKLNAIHTIPIGDDTTYEMSDKLPSDITFFFTTNHRFSIIQSKYSNATSSMSNAIEGRNILNIGIDESFKISQIQQQQQLIQKSDKCKMDLAEVERKINILKEEITEILNERRAIKEKCDFFEVCKEKLKRQIVKYEKLSASNNIDIPAERNKLMEKIHGHIEELMEIQTLKLQEYEQYEKYRSEIQLKNEEFTIFNRSIMNIEMEIENRKAEMNRALDFVKKITDLLDRIKIQCKKLHNEAKQKTNGKTPGDKSSFPFKKQFDKLPKTIEDLHAHMDDLQVKIELMCETDQSVITEYENREVQIKNLRRAIENFDNEQNQVENQMEKIHTEWFSKINEIVDIINTNFSNFMSSMGFAGEVELIKKDLRDYDDYGIQIRVKYRNNEKLLALDRFVQSGGERAVAIAIYTLSLQQITKVPFRCVDEINQGMDPRNERKIFEMLVDETAQYGKSQYFFVTPKLLPNLKYNDLMTFHIVHNCKSGIKPDFFNQPMDYV